MGGEDLLENTNTDVEIQLSCEIYFNTNISCELYLTGASELDKISDRIGVVPQDSYQEYSVSCNTKATYLKGKDDEVIRVYFPRSKGTLYVRNFKLTLKYTRKAGTLI